MKNVDCHVSEGYIKAEESTVASVRRVLQSQIRVGKTSLSIERRGQPSLCFLVMTALTLGICLSANAVTWRVCPVQLLAHEQRSLSHHLSTWESTDGPRLEKKEYA